MTVAFHARARELHAMVLKDAAAFVRAIAPTQPPSLRWRTYADPLAKLDVDEANRALALGADVYDVAFTLAARRLAWQHGASPVREAVEQGRLRAMIEVIEREARRPLAT